MIKVWLCFLWWVKFVAALFLCVRATGGRPFKCWFVVLQRLHQLELIQVQTPTVGCSAGENSVAVLNLSWFVLSRDPNLPSHTLPTHCKTTQNVLVNKAWICKKAWKRFSVHAAKVVTSIGIKHEGEGWKCPFDLRSIQLTCCFSCHHFLGIWRVPKTTPRKVNIGNL